MRNQLQGREEREQDTIASLKDDQASTGCGGVRWSQLFYSDGNRHTGFFTSTRLVYRHPKNLRPVVWREGGLLFHIPWNYSDSEQVRTNSQKNSYTSTVHQCTKPSPWTDTQKPLPWRSWYFTELYDSVGGSLHTALMQNTLCLRVLSWNFRECWFCVAVRQTLLVWPMKMYLVTAFLYLIIGQSMKWADKTCPTCRN